MDDYGLIMKISKYLSSFLLLVIIAAGPTLALAAQEAASGVEPAFDQDIPVESVSPPTTTDSASDATTDNPAPESSEKTAPVSEQELQLPEQARNINNQTYEDWLERYRAWDKLDTVYAEKVESPEATLRRIENLLEAGQPDKAFQLVEQTPPFSESNKYESRRLWLGGRALRALGSPNQALMWFSQAGKLLPTQELRDTFTKEYGLDVVWSDVFRNLFWTYVSTYSLNREAQEAFLQLIVDQALIVWPQTPFWRTASHVFEETLPKSDADTDGSSDGPKETYFVNKNERKRIAQALAAASVHRISPAATLADIKNEAVRVFWTDVVEALAGQDPKNHEALFEEERYVKASSFAGSAPFKYLSKNSEQWIYSAPDRRLEIFMGNLMALSPARAHELFQTGEVDKLMPDSEPLNGVATVRLAVAIMAGDVKAAREAWDGLQPTSLPLAMRLAGVILFNLDTSEVSGISDADAQSNRILAALASAAGNAPALAYEAPFWVRVEQGKINTTMLNTWPLDKELVFAGWREQWIGNPSSELARRVAFLFPEQQFGMKCALYLAGKAVQDKQLGLASYYLSAVSVEDANATLQAERLEVKAELEVARNLMPEAYASYQELLATGAPISDVTRLKIAFLMQQMGDLEGGRSNLQTLWNKRETFSTAMQAEILFYLGEGEASLGNQDQALDYYLQLAWQYPQESMWALTAMYRASNIYEQREQYEPAVRLLQTVIKNAETPKQREAATARLDSIKGMMGKPSAAGPGAVPYPF